jgi:ribosomal protein L11 methyltransferase
MIPDGGLVVVAARRDDANAALVALAAHGAGPVEEQSMGCDRVLVYGRFAGEASARGAVVALRDAGWPAVVRPLAGGHLTAWRNHTRPIDVAGRVWVCFPWSEFDRGQAPAVVEIDPGRAFGTGAHPSTRLLMVELAVRLAGGESVLDVGCGSGVLAVTAARLGAGTVVATDLNDEALVATRANAARNEVAGRIETSASSVEDLEAVFDVIVANIGAATLIELAPSIQPRLAAGGWLGLSGLSPAQVSKVAAAYDRVQVASLPTEEDWAAVVATPALTR